MIQSVWKNLTGLQKAAEHLCSDFITHHQTPMTCPFHYMAKVLTPPSLEEKKTTPNCGNKDGNIIHVLKLYCTSFEVYEVTVPICTSHWVFVDEFVAHLKSHQSVFSCFLQTRFKFFHTD